MRLTDEEVVRLAKFKGLSERVFIETYTRLAHYRNGLALTEKPNGECIFLEGRNCSVQAVKPQQCRDFPNLWRFSGFEVACGSIPREVAEEEWERLVLEATGRKSHGERAESTGYNSILPAGFK